jgi:citrate synthase
MTTWIGSSGPDHITMADRDLPGEIMGSLSLTDLTHLLITHSEPTSGQRRVLDAVLVSLADHGLTPSALSARLTYTGAPEAIQGAVAAGLLGAGSVFLGPTGDTAEFLAAALAGVDDEPDDASLEQVATSAVSARLDAGLRVPGLGHPVHKTADPRTARLYELAEQEGTLGPHLRLLRIVAGVQEEFSGRALPINGAGAAGAALADLGYPPAIVRGVVLIGRTAGLVAQLAEEAEQPIGPALWMQADGHG